MMYPSRSVLLGQTNSIEDALAGSVGRMRSHLAFQNKSALSRAKQFGSRWVDFRNATPNSYSYGMGVDPSTVDFRNAPSSTSSSGVGVVPIEPLGATRPRLGVDQVGFGRRFLGSSPGSAPEVVQRDQYGLSTPLGQGNIDNTRSRVSPGVLGRQKSTETGYMGSLGGGSSEVHRIGGKNVVMGGGTLQRYSEAIGVGMSPEEAYAKAKVGAEQRSRDANMANPVYAAMQERKQQAWQDRLAEKSAIRSMYKAKKLGLPQDADAMAMLGKGSSGSGTISRVSPLSSKTDIAQRQAKASSDALSTIGPDEFRHLGLSGVADYGSLHAHRVIEAMNSPEFDQMSREGALQFNDFLQHYMNHNQNKWWMNSSAKKAIQSYLAGNRDAVKKYYEEFKKNRHFPI